MADEAETAPDLSYITTEDLVHELERRCDSLALAAVIKVDQRSEGNTTATYWYTGCIYQAIGMAEQLRSDLVTRTGPLFNAPRSGRANNGA